MRTRRRLAALVVQLLMIQLVIVGGGWSCSMGRASMGASDHTAGSRMEHGSPNGESTGASSGSGGSRYESGHHAPQHCDGACLPGACVAGAHCGTQWSVAVVSADLGPTAEAHAPSRQDGVPSSPAMSPE